jgi:hypothetical protein
MAARIAILVCLYLFLVAAYRELYRTVRETRPPAGDGGPPPDERVLPTLTVVRAEATPELEGEVIPLLTANTIGRATDNAIVLSDPSVSGFHARIDFDQDRFVLADMNSTNGTLLNDSPVTKPTVLRPGDRIQLGSVTVVFRAG